MCATKHEGDIVTHVCTESNRLSRIELDVSEVKEMIRDIDKKLFKGNGQPALITSVHLLDMRVSEIEKSPEKRGNRWMLYATVAMAVSAWIPILIQAISK